MCSYMMKKGRTSISYSRKGRLRYLSPISTRRVRELKYKSSLIYNLSTVTMYEQDLHIYLLP